MLLNILFGIVGIFTIVFFESFLIALFNFRVVVILLLFLFKKVDWKILLLLFSLLFFISDVVNNLPLGSNLLINSAILGVLMLSSLFFSLGSDITGSFVRIFVFTLYYILLKILPSFLISGKLGFLDLKDVFFALLKAVVSTLLVLLIEYVLAGFRERGNTSKIRLK
jgi:hypothetical protein